MQDTPVFGKVPGTPAFGKAPDSPVFSELYALHRPTLHTRLSGARAGMYSARQTRLEITAYKAE